MRRLTERAKIRCLLMLVGLQSACSAGTCPEPGCEDGVLLLFEDPLARGSSLVIELWLDEVFLECSLLEGERSPCEEAGVEVNGESALESIYLRDRAPVRVDVSIFEGEAHPLQATVWPYYVQEEACDGETCHAGYGWL